ncbi:hypothetical protein AGMMS49990_05020 [Endomicrobiia bacterium]|nr:hypothetical protein AGMMS49990_05020 [Endomicrobiia bacterium]
MKKLSFLVLLVLSVFAANVFAEGEVDVWSGYTRLDFDRNIDKFVDNNNDYLKKVSDGMFEVSKFLGPDSERFAEISKVIADLDGLKMDSSGKMGNVFAVGVDCFFGGDENVKHGLRAAYLQSGKRKIFMSKNGVPIDGASCISSASLISVMPGVKASYDISEKFSLNGKLFAGIAKSNRVSGFNLKFAVGNVVNIYYTYPFGYKFAMDMSVGAQYLFTKKFGLGLDLGYRPFPSGFSGFTAKLGLNFKI